MCACVISLRRSDNLCLLNTAVRPTEPRFQGRDSTEYSGLPVSGDVAPARRAQNVFNKHNKLQGTKTKGGKDMIDYV